MQLLAFLVLAEEIVTAMSGLIMATVDLPGAVWFSRDS